MTAENLVQVFNDGRRGKRVGGGVGMGPVFRVAMPDGLSDVDPRETVG